MNNPVPALEEAAAARGALAAAGRYALAAVACAAVTALATPLRGVLDLAGIVMLYLLVVLGAALLLGRGPAVAGAFLGVALFDFFFVPPRFTFAVDNPSAILTFGVMLAVGLVTAELVSRVRRQAALAADRARESHRLYEAARRLAGAVSVEQVRSALDGYLAAMDCRVAVHLLDAGGAIESLGANLAAAKLARAAIDMGEPVDASGLGDPEGPQALVPLRGPTRVLGVLALSTQPGHRLEVAEEKDRLLTLAGLAAIALERLADHR